MAGGNSGWGSLTGSAPPPPSSSKKSTSPSRLYVIYRNGKIAFTPKLTNNVLTYDGIPITKSLLWQQVQDKTGIGGDYYSLTGKPPNPVLVARLMSGDFKMGGRKLNPNPTMQEIDNFLMESPDFIKSPTGKKYQATYQDVWEQVMGKNQNVPTKMVVEAAKNNLDATEFAAKLRQSPVYLQGNEYKSRVDAYTLSYERIYGTNLKDPGFKSLASDAALAGWDSTQWEAYLRSLPQYTSTPEYQGHAMGLLNQLGMDFGMMFGLGSGGYTPPSTADQLEGPSPDKRINQGQTPKPGSSDLNDLGVTVVGGSNAQST